MKKYYIITFLFISTILTAQGGSALISNARSVALGNNYTAVVRGINAIGTNPANLALQERFTTEFTLSLPIPNVSFSLGNDFLSIDDYNRFFSGEKGDFDSPGKFLDDNEKKEFRGLFSDVSKLSSNASASFIAFKTYLRKTETAFAFAINDRFAFNSDIPLEVVNFLLDGNELEKTFDFSDTDLKSWYLRDISFSFAQKMDFFNSKSASVGVSLKIIQGYFYSGVEKINTTITTLEDKSIEVSSDLLFKIAASPSFGIEYDFEGDTSKSSNVGLFPESAGTGVGFDFGFAAELNDRWAIGLSLTDIGSVSWKKETVEYKAEGVFTLTDITEEDQVDSLKDALKGEGNYSDEFSTNLATSLNMGCTFRPGESKKLLLAFDYRQGFNNQPGNTTTPRVAIGAEFRTIDWILIRSGFSFGGIDKFNWGFGVGIGSGLFEFNIATTDLHYLFAGNSAKIARHR
jgi:hypothetical protein